MERVCGIYKISNIKDGKSYIGQSLNVYGRWKQHTQSIDQVVNLDGENPLRRAFCKYGLKKQVSEPGEYNGFKFEVLQHCQSEELTDLEYEWIKKLNPEYNIMMCPPSKDRKWPVREKLESSCYVQYHNFNVLAYTPYENQVFSKEDSSYIVSKKRDSLRCKGDRVYLVVGIKQKGRTRKQFFLWGYEQIEEVDCTEFFDGSKCYGLRGTYFKCKSPIELNSLDGFEYFFKKTMGSFAYGLQNAAKDPFSKFLMDEGNFEKEDSEKDNVDHLTWLCDFEENYITEDDFRLTRRLSDGSSELWFSYVEEEEVVKHRASLLFSDFPEQFAPMLSRKKEINTVVYQLSYSTMKFISLVPNKKHVVCYYSSIKYKRGLLSSLKKLPNVELMDWDEE